MELLSASSNYVHAPLSCHFDFLYATGQIKDPVPLIEKSRASSPGGRFPPGFIHQVIIITGLKKLYDFMFSH